MEVRSRPRRPRTNLRALSAVTWSSGRIPLLLFPVLHSNSFHLLILRLWNYSKENVTRQGTCAVVEFKTPAFQYKHLCKTMFAVCTCLPHFFYSFFVLTGLFSGECFTAKSIWDLSVLYFVSNWPSGAYCTIEESNLSQNYLVEGLREPSWIYWWNSRTGGDSSNSRCGRSYLWTGTILDPST